VKDTQQFAHGLPADQLAERSVLGGILLSNELYNEAADALHVEDFSLDAHRRIFSAMHNLANSSAAMDLVTLRNMLRSSKELETVGGIAYLASLTELMPKRTSLESHIRIVVEKARLRSMIALLSDGITQCADQSDESDAISAALEDALMANRAKVIDAETIDVQSFNEWEVFNREISGDRKRFYSTGILELDRKSGGLAAGEMTVLGGWPGQGKTSLVVQIAVRHCSAGTPMLVISPEMTSGQFLRRAWAEVSGISASLLRHPERLNPDELKRLEQAYLHVATWPLHFDPAYGITAQQAAARARLHKMRNHIEIVAIDYLQKLKFSSKHSERSIEVGDAAVTFSNLAKHEQLAVLVLSSLTAPSGRAVGNPPSLGDLRMNGDIQYEASTVWLVHRPVDVETSEVLEDGEIIQAKGRSDGTGNILIRFNPHTLTFEDRRVF
jgi:replicative DNA helicase